MRCRRRCNLLLLVPAVHRRGVVKIGVMIRIVLVIERIGHGEEPVIVIVVVRVVVTMVEARLAVVILL